VSLLAIHEFRLIINVLILYNVSFTSANVTFLKSVPIFLLLLLYLRLGIRKNRLYLNHCRCIPDIPRM